MLLIRSLSKRMFFLLKVVSPSVVVVVPHVVGKPYSHQCHLRCNAINFKFLSPCMCLRRALLLLRGKLDSYPVIGCFITGLRKWSQTTP